MAGVRCPTSCSISPLKWQRKEDVMRVLWNEIKTERRQYHHGQNRLRKINLIYCKSNYTRIMIYKPKS